MKNQKRIVVKIGTSTLTGGGSTLNKPRIVSIAQQISCLFDKGHQIILVSSGAIAAGREQLGFPDLPKTIPAKQMLAALGQPRLMNTYQQIFGIFELNVAQVLLTREDISDRKRYINARNTVDSILGQRVLPIINENDTVATDEISIGDNDNLSALVANLIEADLLILLTDQEGFFTADPNQHKDARLIEIIENEEYSPSILQAAGGSHNGLGTGGMATKLQAADIARRSGCQVIIASGDVQNILIRLVDGEKIGTRIMPLVEKMESRKRFMLAGVVTHAYIIIDNGAAGALLKGGSLLPVGITQVDGKFERGDIVRVRDVNRKDCALGLVNYSSEDIQKLKGRHSEEIEQILGFAFGDEIIHHNNMTLLTGLS